jgi:hypothetical protein
MDLDYDDRLLDKVWPMYHAASDKADFLSRLNEIYSEHDTGGYDDDDDDCPRATWSDDGGCLVVTHKWRASDDPEQELRWPEPIRVARGKQSKLAFAAVPAPAAATPAATAAAAAAPAVPAPAPDTPAMPVDQAPPLPEDSQDDGDPWGDLEDHLDARDAEVGHHPTLQICMT